jgi:hypothetical protein
VHAVCVWYVPLHRFHWSSCTEGILPVSRPLFIEEHGLRLLLDREGVGVELSREAYEAGDWAATVQEAYTRGKALKAKKRADGAVGIGMDKRQIEGREIALKAVEWVRETWGEDLPRVNP